ncbi:MarR family winged helix-turn-helix transcriptional regulator [Swingsia samuiensis]|uniref:MarR family transcriptional regulator n=1 Tax=Swingsia samuiensis TaxID=1293412 RepID=A0A4Y6UHV8_9PROT|nr:MarR family transcriptional regulator [Swingsia samuiensis]QDH16238.1 MarR family transcriptional regulator [Swingsia samuiensis]
MTFGPAEERKSVAAHLYLREEQIRHSYELLLRAWRSLNAECDVLLRENGLGAAHHRILFLVAYHPGITFSELLESLGVTKQSLSRALNELLERSFLVQERDDKDRRKRPLRLTSQGEEIEKKLFLLLRDVMTRSYKEAGMTAVEGFKKVLSPLQRVSQEVSDAR